MHLNAFYIVGFPGETKENIKATVDFAISRFQKYGAFPFMFKLQSLPGTPLYEMVKNGGFYYGDSLKITHNQIVTKEFDPSFIDSIHKEYDKRRIKVIVLRILTKKKEMKYYFWRIVDRLRPSHKQSIYKIFKQIWGSPS